MAERLSRAECAALWARAAGKAPLSTLWRHRKSGDCYRVASRALLESDLTPVVSYTPADGGSPMVVWCRPLAEFLEKFEEVKDS